MRDLTMEEVEIVTGGWPIRINN